MLWLQNQIVPTLVVLIEVECLEQGKEWFCPNSCWSAPSWNGVSSSKYWTLMPIQTNSSILKKNHIESKDTIR